MLQAFIITLREGVEAALIVGHHSGLPDQDRAAMTCARPFMRRWRRRLLGSIGVAIVISRTHLNEDAFEGWVMLVAAFFVVTMVDFHDEDGAQAEGRDRGQGRAAGGQ